MSEPLEPCPFCGNPSPRHTASEIGSEVVCGRCGGSIRRTHLGYHGLWPEDEAVRDWNRRAPGWRSINVNHLTPEPYTYLLQGAILMLDPRLRPYPAVSIAPLPDSRWLFQIAQYDPVRELSTDELLAELRSLVQPWERNPALTHSTVEIEDF